MVFTWLAGNEFVSARSSGDRVSSVLGIIILLFFSNSGESFLMKLVVSRRPTFFIIIGLTLSVGLIDVLTRVHPPLFGKA